MKIIAMMPVKNEAWILPCTLDALSQFCDMIIVADQMSDDGSREICLNHPKVLLIDNPEKGHSNKVRWRMLDIARDYDGYNLLLSVDADEIMPPQLFKAALNHFIPKLERGYWLEFWWVQLWKSIDSYRDDQSVWSNLWKPIGFLDNRKLDYNRQFVINDHTSRVPGPANNPTIRVTDVPLIHLQWAMWRRTQVKQAWYRCTELIENPQDWLNINAKYAITLNDPDAQCSPVPPEWFKEVCIPKQIESLSPAWHLEAILRYFEEYGIEFFEPLQIWHIPALKAQFVQMVGREPISKVISPTRRELHRVRSLVSKALPTRVKSWIRGAMR